MTTIRTTCPRCGEVDMGPESILLSVIEGGREGTYRFTCPTCMDAVEKRADRKIVALLVSAGVDVTSRGTELFEEDDLDTLLPAPRTEPLERRPGGPAFTADDLIEFHFLLQDENFLRELLDAQ